jgi:hypothetical protein
VKGTGAGKTRNGRAIAASGMIEKARLSRRDHPPKRSYADNGVLGAQEALDRLDPADVDEIACRGVADSRRLRDLVDGEDFIGRRRGEKGHGSMAPRGKSLAAGPQCVSNQLLVFRPESRRSVGRRPAWAVVT